MIKYFKVDHNFKAMSSHIYEKFLNLDMYASPITILFEGRDSHKTSIGSIISLLIYLFILYLGIVSGIEMVRFDNPTIKTYTLERNQEAFLGQKEFRLNENGLNFIFAWLTQNE